MRVRRHRSNARNPIEFTPLEPRRLLSATALLSATQVDKILADAASQAGPQEVITVVGREGEILGIFARAGADLGPVRDQGGHLGTDDSIILGTVAASVSRARTAAYFESKGEAFTTRTARFIIQNHFPQPLDNTPGGPLYGVEFSSLPTSDVTPGTGLSGDPGGVPLYIDGQPVGGIGVAGPSDGVLAGPNLPYAFGTHPTLYNGVEETSADEAVALAGEKGFAPPSDITANNIFVGGLRLPYTAEKAASGRPKLSLPSLLDDNAGELVLADAQVVGVSLENNQTLGFQTRSSAAVIAEPSTDYPSFTVDGNTGTLKNTNPAAMALPADPGGLVTDPSAVQFGIVRGVGSEGQHLSVKDVKQIITQTVAQALITRAGIREPLGTNAVIHVAVTDTEGNILGVFAMNDATNFSYDVAVQKARTAAFFSTDKAAISDTALGFISQGYFPQGIEGSRSGPLYELQNELSLDVPASQAPLQNGITIFPGGFPLYKNGVLVGAIGVSGDGVTQDDLMAYTGADGFHASTAIEADSLSGQTLVNLFESKLATLKEMYPELEAIITKCDKRLSAGFDGVRLPYAKFPRQALTSQ
jgi:uncharacterized protein GlcG (DUF336 family)